MLWKVERDVLLEKEEAPYQSDQTFDACSRWIGLHVFNLPFRCLFCRSNEPVDRALGWRAGIVQRAGAPSPVFLACLQRVW